MGSEDVIALARAVGLSGIRPAQSEEEISAVASVRRSLGHAVGPDATVALARRLGLSGISLDCDAHLLGRDPLAESSPRSVQASPPPDVRGTTEPRPAPPAASPLRSTDFVVIDFHGQDGAGALRQFEARHGSLCADVNGTAGLLASRGSARSRLLYRLPEDVASADLVRARQGAFLSGVAAIAVHNGANLSEYAFVTKAGNLIGSSAMAPIPTLPDSVLRALGGRG